MYVVTRLQQALDLRPNCVSENVGINQVLYPHTQ